MILKKIIEKGGIMAILIKILIIIIEDIMISVDIKLNINKKIKGKNLFMLKKIIIKMINIII